MFNVIGERRIKIALVGCGRIANNHFAAIEKHHEERYRKLLANLEAGITFKRTEDTVWICSNCGHIVVAKEAPAVCPVCAHPKAYFMINCECF